MAANHYRALLGEFGISKRDVRQQAEILRFSIGNAPTFMWLDTESYTRLADWCDKVMEMVDDPGYAERDELRGIIMELLPAIGQEWLDLDKPDDSQDWGEAKWGGES